MAPLAPTWSLWLMVGFLAGAVLAGTLAAVVYLADPARLQNRALALLLIVEALSSAATVVHLGFDGPGIALAGLFTFFLFWLLTLAIYPLFLGTLRTPLAGPIRSRWFLGPFWFACGALCILMFPFAERFLVGPVRIGGAFEYAYGPWAQAVVLVSLPLLLYALAVAVSAWRRAQPGSALRAQGRAYATAFLVRDGLMVVSVANFLVLPWFVAQGVFGSVGALAIGRGIYIAQIVLFPLIAGYGILRHQLFDIDLKVKRTLTRGTLVALLTAAFFIAKETVEYLLPLDGLLPSLAGAAAVGAFAVPAWRAAARFADRAMPQVTDTAAYRERRRHELYRAAVESALVDGAVTTKERDVLDTLVRQLGIPRDEAQRIERLASSVAGGN